MAEPLWNFTRTVYFWPGEMAASGLCSGRGWCTEPPAKPAGLQRKIQSQIECEFWPVFLLIEAY